MPPTWNQFKSCYFDRGEVIQYLFWRGHDRDLRVVRAAGRALPREEEDRDEVVGVDAFTIKQPFRQTLPENDVIKRKVIHKVHKSKGRTLFVVYV